MTATNHGGRVSREELHRRRSDTTDDSLPPGALQRAVLLVGAVHDEGPREVGMLLNPLTRDDLNAVVVTLAAMVPADYTPAELLAWNDAQYNRPLATPYPGDQPPLFPAVAANGHRLRPHGTHAAFARHKNAGEDPCEPCVFGERDYQRNRKRNNRANASEATG